MGCLNSSPDATKDKQLTKELGGEQKKDKYIKKMLFLGSGGSGKSTLFKQLKKIHGTGWSEEDRIGFIDHIHAQIIEQMKLALECVEIMAEEQISDQNVGIDAAGGASEQQQQAQAQAQAQEINAFADWTEQAQNAVTTLQSVKDPKLNEEIAECCKLLWQQDVIRNVYENRAQMKIEDSSAYFWDKIDDIMMSGYIPSEEDILLVRYRTTGVIDMKFTMEKNIFHVYDVGGQQSERKKWIHCFEHVTAVIFVASLSCYDEVMFEDESINSMVDSLELFDSVCNNTYFEKTAMILFLNKKDLFADKLAQGKSITLCPEFTDYAGNQTSFDDTTDYIRDAFVARNKSADQKSIFTHLTCATDQNNVHKVFNDVQHIIIESSLESAGLIGDLAGDDKSDSGAEFVKR